MLRNWITAVTLVAGLLLGTGLWGQEHVHGASTGRPSRVEPTGAVSLPGLLAASDQAVRAIELAAQDGDPPALTEAVEAYTSAMAAVESYLGETEPTRVTRDLPRLEKALARQRSRLQDLADRSTPQAPWALREGLDASDRALDALSAARDSAAGPPADTHHGAGQRRRGCGHH